MPINPKNKRATAAANAAPPKPAKPAAAADGGTAPGPPPPKPPGGGGKGDAMDTGDAKVFSMADPSEVPVSENEIDSDLDGHSCAGTNHSCGAQERSPSRKDSACGQEGQDRAQARTHTK